MLYYKTLELGNVAQIATELNKLISAEFLEKTSFRNLDTDQVRSIDLLWEELNKINLFNSDLIGAHVICVHPGRMIPHIDGGKSGVVLNWPILNCANTRTAFYQLKEGTPEIKPSLTDDGLDYFIFSDDDIIEVDSIEYSKTPVLLAVNYIHNIINPTDLPRVTVSLRFKHQLSLD